MPRIFLSFRKSDERLIRDRLYQALEQQFGADQVFKSGVTIPPGKAYDPILRRQAADCQIMLALIGPRWAGQADEHGRSDLDRPDDWVRTEIATSLQSGNTVVPVLIGEGTKLPSAEELPGDIEELATLQFRRIDDSRVDAGIAEVIKALIELQPTLERTTPMPQTPAENGKSSASTNVTARKTGNIASTYGSGTTIGGDYKATTRNTTKKGHPGLYFLGVLAVILVIFILAKVVPTILNDSKNGGLSASSTCQQFLDTDEGTEAQAIVDIADAQNEGGFGSPLALPEIRYQCSGEPNVTLGSVIQQDNGEF